MSAALTIGRSLTDMLGWETAPWERVAISETPTALATDLPIADLASAAQGLAGLAAAEFHRARGGPIQEVRVDRWAASLSMTSSAYLTVNGEKAVSWDPLTGYHETRDGWVYTHCQFAHLRNGLLAAFGLPNDPDVVKAQFAKLAAQEIEDTAQAAGTCAIRHRTRAEWEAHPHCAVLRQVPPIQLSRHGDSAPKPVDVGEMPLQGVRVLDLSRVIAGPMMGRTLGEHGAEVLRISAPHLPFFESLVINTGFNKRAAHVDLRTADGQQTFKRLVAEADVVIDGYRPGALAGHGFGFEDLREINPSLVYITLSAFGETGPWGGRRGYDTYVQAGTGLTAGSGAPTRLPCQPLDYLGGILGASAAMIALIRRQQEGGTWRAELSLARNAMWIWEWADRLGRDPDAPAANPTLDEAAAVLQEMPSEFGLIRAMRPARDLSHTPPSWRHAPVALGTHTPSWA